MKTDFNNVSVEELKKEFPYEYDESNPRFNAINDLLFEKLLLIQQHRQNKTRLMMVEELPEAFKLFDMRKEIKPFKHKMRLKIRTLKVLYNRRNDKAFNERLNKRLEKEIKKRTKVKSNLLLENKQQ